jgi:hypothetical protein
VDLKRLAAPFRPDDIEWRVGQSGVKGDGSVWAKVLAYVTNRAIQQRLDDVCGPQHWRNEFREWTAGTAGVLCGISIRDPQTGEWVTKWDGAEQTDIEKVKGGLSNAMKRAGYQWGIGRYLYDLPEGFARIVAKGTKGAHYASAKPRTGDKVDYYWLPPELPRWAQPTEAPDEVKPEPEPVKVAEVDTPQTGYEAARQRATVPTGLAASEAQRSDFAPTEKQILFFQRLAEAPVFTEEERKRALDWLATKATRQTIKDQLDWLKRQVETRKGKAETG